MIEPVEPDADPGDPLADLRDAAGEVVASLKKLVEAAERAMGDPAAADSIVSCGRSVVDAFTRGFSGGESPEPTADPDPESDPSDDPVMR